MLQYVPARQIKLRIPNLQVRTAEKYIYNVKFRNNAKITPKMWGENGDIWEYAAPVLTVFF